MLDVDPLIGKSARRRCQIADPIDEGKSPCARLGQNRLAVDQAAGAARPEPIGGQNRDENIAVITGDFTKPHAGAGPCFGNVGKGPIAWPGDQGALGTLLRQFASAGPFVGLGEGADNDDIGALDRGVCPGNLSVLTVVGKRCGAHSLIGTA